MTDGNPARNAGPKVPAWLVVVIVVAVIVGILYGNGVNWGSPKDGAFDCYSNNGADFRSSAPYQAWVSDGSVVDFGSEQLDIRLVDGEPDFDNALRFERIGYGNPSSVSRYGEFFQMPTNVGSVGCSWRGY